MKPEQYSEKSLELEGWPIHVVGYKLGDTYHCKVDNVSPGAQIARGEGETAEEAERIALEKAERRLKQSRRFPTP